MRQQVNTALQKAMYHAKTQLYSIKTTASVRFAQLNPGPTWDEIQKAAVPANIRFDFPVFFFGGFDKPTYEVGFKQFPVNIDGLYPFFGYGTGSTIPWTLREIFYYGQQLESNAAEIALPDVTAPAKFFKLGDLIFEFLAYSAPNNYKAFVIISCDKMSYSSLLNESDFNSFTTRNILYFSDNIRNYNTPIDIVKFTPQGLYKVDQYNPLASKPIDTVQQDFIKMELSLNMSRYIGLYTKILFNTNKITFEYNFNF